MKMPNLYLAILEKEPDSLWSLWFPDLPGCATAGGTAEAARTRATEALRLFVEDMLADGETPPPSRPLDALAEDEDARAALARGGAIVAVPLLLSEGSATRVNVSLDRGALRAIDAAAERRGVTRSTFLVESALARIGAEG